ncbi:MAG: crossover junction endodeoxyribonuclease RuvC [Chloroflexi bacterium]|nr:crossover junction endodeoxyribonuclease RuvC [Chloroflexota bacterium]
MRILGIDPGTARLGYGVIEDTPQLSVVTYGCLTTPAKDSQPDRLFSIYRQLGEIFETAAPDEVAVEQLFFNQNITTAFAVGEARGIVLLRAAEAGCPVSDYSPLQVKQALVGYGRADKRQVQTMVSMALALEKPPRPDDAADALAVAICHAHMRTAQQLLAQT